MNFDSCSCRLQGPAGSHVETKNTIPASRTSPTYPPTGSSDSLSWPRVVDMFARDLQLQEGLTTQVAGWVTAAVTAQRSGRSARGRASLHADAGVQKPGARTVTSALHGRVRDDPRTREEFLSLTGGR